MENRIQIGDFVKLTGSTLKTINYYHKIGLLADAERSAGGYRLYGPEDLNRMRVIKHLKSLGLNLSQIKEVIGNLPSPKTSREVLQSLRRELLNEQKNLEERLSKIDVLLEGDAPLLDGDSFDPPSFEMITEILGAEQMGKYAETCPEIYDQHRKLNGILDDFKWGEEHQEGFRALAEYFKTNPEQYQLALELGARWAELADLSEDDSRIESFAREAVAMVNSMPQVKELYTHPGMQDRPLNGLYQEMVAGVLSPAQLKYQQLFKEMLLSEDQ